MSFIVTKKMSLEEAKALGINTWSTWECEPSVFDWHYSEKETAYIFEGEVTVTANGEETHIGPNMLVVFPKDLSCVWHVHKTIKKVYKFD